MKTYGRIEAFLKIYLNITFPSTLRFAKWSLFPSYFPNKIFAELIKGYIGALLL